MPWKTEESQVVIPGTFMQLIWMKMWQKCTE